MLAMLLCSPYMGVTAAGQPAESVYKDYLVAAEYCCTAEEGAATVHYYRESLDAEPLTYARRWRVMGGGWGTRNIRVMKNGKRVGRLKRIPMEKGTVIMLANGAKVAPHHQYLYKGINYFLFTHPSEPVL